MTSGHVTGRVTVRGGLVLKAVVSAVTSVGGFIPDRRLSTRFSQRPETREALSADTDRTSDVISERIGQPGDVILRGWS